ncbi:AAA family ATPase [uncultured Parabacteroides sp.]|uniref:ATP-binding protein n=1 Tax=uncultured Parabacteroides sp. TaxID=512312 RepID=UPI00280500BE|nr:AAA family ATPase [uncultured Parabacteroides sp.]
MERLQNRYKKLLLETDTRFHRYMYNRINWNNRMIGLTGPRGIGKTTLVLQYIKENLPTDNSLYVTAEDFYFADHRLLDLADTFVKSGGKHLFIDEIHRYNDWSRELKLIYDYHPELQVVFTGSSVLDINKGISDLSRRAAMYHMQGLSFREYLQLFHNLTFPVYSLAEILQLKVEIPIQFHPYQFFPDYLKRGYYPFSSEDPYIYIQQIVNLTLEADIPQFAGMNVSTGRKLKQLLAIIAKSVPFKPNISNIATALNVSRNSVADYCLYVEEAGLIAQLRDDTGGIRGLGKVEKIYLDNTNLIYSLAGENSEIGNIRETFFFNQMRVNQDVITSSASDFCIEGYTFEIGGRKKGNKQIEGLPDAFVVKDNIEFAFAHTIPLWHFGFNY